ncbi:MULTISPECIES: hypothetical protein [Streptomyces]|uniref:Uncharacterized protein n=8 Tax=Streptomyces TaxID=1883 RepID=A0AAP6EJ15_9ACTN|nr:MULTISPECIES: hypothetical protein [Streptomyces]MBP5872894.1 hypothetical protein [Streptomyces sp. LBUM 1485]KFG05661.1 hypothetical protein IQ61_28780 [Streptomyces scabiei]KND42067.1 hypothetical protein IQ64_25655 [Streptomyces stelliscabiei]MBE1595510.1 hypothetical protein [Streptomyces stelliscabiei]MBZ3902207.1 hypothetical protein [Streptomyces griseiscabiei]
MTSKFLMSGRLELTAAGAPVTPLHVVPLDGMDWDDPLLPPRVAPAPLLVGVATAPLPPEAVPVVEQLTVTLGGGLAPYCAGTASDVDAVRATVAGAP